MGSVTGQAYRFERVRVIRDLGSDKSLFVITIKDSFNPFAPEPPVTARADPGPFYPL